MTKQFYLGRLEKGIKIINMYNIMINGQQNYKTLPHYMKVFGDFCVDYLKYQTIEVERQVHHMESVTELLEVCKRYDIEVVNGLKDESEFIQKCKEMTYTDVAECMGLMPKTTELINGIKEAISPQA